MVSIRHWEAEKFLAKPPEHVAFYLFYGSDAGLVNERLRGVIQNFVVDVYHDFQVIRLDGDEIASDVGRLSDEINAIGLFGSRRRAVWIKAGSRNLVPALEENLNRIQADTLVVIEAGALKKESALRRIFERERHAAAIECNHDTSEQLRSVILAEAKSQGLEIDRQTTDLLVHSLGADRLTTRSELSKLMLYTHGQQRISELDVAEVIADAKNVSLDAAVTAAFSGYIDQVDRAVGDALDSGADPGFLIGMAIRHAVMLQRAKIDMDLGVHRDVALERASKRAFIFTKRDLLAVHIERWSVSTLAVAVDALGRSLLDIRKDAKLGATIVSRVFLALASMGRRGANR
jgi:DNA polymerase-3 subunit delta